MSETPATKGVEIFYLVWRDFELEVSGSSQNVVFFFSLDYRYCREIVLRLQLSN